MFDKVYSKDNSENLRIFNDIVEPKKNFSNYSVELNRLFGDKTYAAFYKNLIKHKRVKCSNFISIFQKPKKHFAGTKIYDEPFNIANFEEALNNMKLKREKINYRVNNPYISRPPINCVTKIKTEKLLKKIKKQKLATKYKSNSKLKLHKDNIYLPEVPDVGRYNPSYDVLRKHTYQACFSTTNFHDFNKDNKQFNDRKLFVKINDLYFEEDSKFNKDKIKQISKNANTINNMSKTEMNNMNKNNKTKLDKKQNLYLSTSPLFKNRNNTKKDNDNNINSNSKEELNNTSNNMSDSQVLIRTNGDLNLRCPKHVTNLYNTSTHFSFDDSKMNNSGINDKSIHFINLKKNHCLKFDNYSKRKPIITKLNNTMEHFTNAEAFNLNYPIRNKNACIEFNKLSTGKNKQKSTFEFEANKNKYPPLGAYSPKYDSTFGKIIKNIYMNKNNRHFPKKRKLQKIMFNYNVPTKYILFQSLNK